MVSPVNTYTTLRFRCTNSFSDILSVMRIRGTSSDDGFYVLVLLIRLFVTDTFGPFIRSVYISRTCLSRNRETFVSLYFG